MTSGFGLGIQRIPNLLIGIMVSQIIVTAMKIVSPYLEHMMAFGMIETVETKFMPFVLLVQLLQHQVKLP